MSRRKTNSPSLNARTQRKHVERLELIGHTKVTIVIPEKYQHDINIYSTGKRLFKKDVWTDVVRKGMQALNIPLN